MIIVKLIGGLGNQMFQYAAGRHLAHLRNTALKLDLSFLNADAKGAYTKREYELGVFDLTPSFADPAEVEVFKKLAQNRYRRFLFRKFPSLFKWAYMSEGGLHYHSELLNCPANTYVEGFWQSEKYFKGVEAIIRKDFNFRTPPTGLNLDLAQKIKSVESVSLHIRRGDYVSDPNAHSFHGTCPPSYYVSGVERIKQSAKNIELFIFSDDAEWCRKNIVFDLPCTYIDHNSGNKSYEDMRLMSLCKHNIIANSSFSWWGAWLNSNVNKMVIAPKRWFNDPSQQPESIYPENWIKL